MSKAAILVPYFQGRRSLLERSLWLLTNQSEPDIEVWLLDDGSDEHIEELADGERVIYQQIRPAGSPPRASNMPWWQGYRKAQADFIILTHPEYMAPRFAVRRMLEDYDGTGRISATALAIKASLMGILDDIPWKADLDSISKAPNFRTFRTPWGWRNADAKAWKHHFAFTGQDRAGWDLLGFMPETPKFGMNDSWAVAEEIRIKRPPIAAGYFVYHQHHRRRQEWPFPEKSARVGRIERHG